MNHCNYSKIRKKPIKDGSYFSYSKSEIFSNSKDDDRNTVPQIDNPQTLELHVVLTQYSMHGKYLPCSKALDKN